MCRAARTETDPRVAAELPPFDRPLLRSEMGPAATLVGNGRAGTGGRLWAAGTLC